MSELEAIRNRARQDLVIVTEDGLEDVHVWEHSLRVTKMARQIADFPDVAANSIDHTVLTAAGLYHDAGWVTQVADGEVTREAIRCKPTSPLQRELSAAMMKRSCEGTLSKQIIDSASACIRALGNHDIDLPEAQLLAEADNLDEFGALALLQLFRKHVIEGKGLEAAIETWKTQERYGYWTARIKDSFRFESVKRIAHLRVQVFDGMIRELSRHHRGEDLADGAAL